MGKFIERLINRKYILSEEIDNIDALLYNEENGVSIYDIFSENFIDWNFRNNFISFESFKDRMGINDIAYRAESEEDITLDEFLYYCEFAMNIVNFVSKESDISNIKYIKENIDNVLEQINYTYSYDDKGLTHIIEKDFLISEAAEIAQNQYDLGYGIYMYNYREINGDLYRKSDILCRLYKYSETIENQARNYGYTDLIDDITALSNKLDVRHAPNGKQKIVLEGMTNEEIEMWFDELYRLYLSLIVLVDYKSKRKDIKNLKSQLG